MAVTRCAWRVRASRPICCRSSEVKPARGRWLRQGEDVSPRDRHVIRPRLVGDAFRLQTEYRRPLRRARRRSSRDCCRHAAVVPVSPLPARRSGCRSASIRTIQLATGPAISCRLSAVSGPVPRWQTLTPRSILPVEDCDPLSVEDAGRLEPERDPVIPHGDALVGSVKARLLILIAAAALVLLTACANVANLSLSKAAARRAKSGIRTAIGASPRRIARQLLTENIVLAFAGGEGRASLCLAVARRVEAGSATRHSAADGCCPELAGPGLHRGSLDCDGLRFGIAPVLGALRLREAVLDSGGRGSSPVVTGPLRAVLTVAQIACAVLLVIAAGLLVGSLWSLSRSDRSFRRDQVGRRGFRRLESLCAYP